MVRTYLGGRVVLSRRVALLAVGDLLAIVAFAAAGEYRHAGTAAAVAETTLQFGVGWVVVGTAAGAYAPRTLESPGRAALLAAAAWAGAAVVGAVVRVATEPGAGISPVFLLVTVGVGAVILAAWRAVAAAGL